MIDVNHFNCIMPLFGALRFYRAALNAWRSSQEKALSVNMSVCPTRALWQNGRNICRRFLYHTKSHL